MQAIRARLVAIAASALLAWLSSLGVSEITPEQGAQVEVWLNHTFELVLFVGYAVIHPWLQARGGSAAARFRPVGTVPARERREEV